MGLSDGVIKVSLKDLSSDLVSTAAYNLTDEEYSPVVQAIGEACLAELKDRIGTPSIKWHEIDLRQFSNAALILAETQLDMLRDEAPEPFSGYFSSFKLIIHHELLRRAEPGLQ